MRLMKQNNTKLGERCPVLHNKVRKGWTGLQADCLLTVNMFLYVPEVLVVVVVVVVLEVEGVVMVTSFNCGVLSMLLALSASSSEERWKKTKHDPMKKLVKGYVNSQKKKILKGHMEEEW